MKVLVFSRYSNLTVCSYHVTYAFQSESTLYSCLNVKELLAPSRREIWNLSDLNWIRTYNHLVHKRTLNHLAKLAKWLSCVVSTYLYGAFDCMFLSCHVRVSEWIHSEYHSEYHSESTLNITLNMTLKRVRDMIRTYSQMHRTDKYSQHSSIIWPVWLNGWVFVYELSGCRFESSWSHLNFRFRACFEKGVPWHSGNYRVWIHSETRTWHDKNIQSNAPYRQVLTTQLNHLASLAKSLSVRLWTRWLWVRIQLQSLIQ